MRIEQHIVSVWAGRIRDKVVDDAVAELERMNGQGGEMLSGGSGLKTVWEEICVQVQGEQSYFWNFYLETMEGVLSGCVELLDPDSRLALWTATDAGWDYVYDHRDENEGVDDVPVMSDEIVSKLMESLLEAAADFENLRVEKFLARYEYGYDELEDEEPDEDEETPEESPESIGPDPEGLVFDLRPSVKDPIYFVITRQQIEGLDINSSLGFLRSLMPADKPQNVWALKGRISLMVDGYDHDPRKLFEIPEVCQYLRAIDDLWPFWFFFFSQADESLTILAMCLSSAIEVNPGEAYVPPDGMKRFLERGFAGVNRVFDTYGFPPAENLALSTGVLWMFSGGTNLEGK